MVIYTTLSTSTLTWSALFNGSFHCMFHFSFCILFLSFLFDFWLYWVFNAMYRFSLVMASRGYFLVSVCRLLIAVVASLVAKHGLKDAWASVAAACWLGSCDTWAELSYFKWDLPGSGIKPMYCSLAGGFLINGPPGRPQIPHANFSNPC